MQEGSKLKGIKFESRAGNQYFYDDLTGHIFNINNNKDIEHIKKLHVDLKIQNKPGDKLEFCADDVKDYLYGLGEGFKQLMLEVTSACNFRCKYCTYSDYYESTRTHGTDFMDFDTAKKAIDYYFDNFEIIRKRNPSRKPIINFYGGEPLLNYDLIKKCVSYIKENYAKYVYDEMYYITTNGYLLTDDVQKFLYENKFNTIVSIDGYKENHDRNRLTAAGEKTFEIVLKNYNSMREKYPDASLGAASCMDYKTDFESIMKFSNKNDIDFVLTSFIESSTGSYYDQFSNQDIATFSENWNEIKNKMFDLVKNNFNSGNKFLAKYIGRLYKDIVFHPKLGNSRTKICPYTGSCVMGEKIYVDVKGNFFLCEKVGCKFSFGHVDTGIDFDKVVSMFRKYRDIACSNCKDCNITKLCGLCFKELDQDLSFSKNKDLCEIQRANQKQMLEDYVTLMELSPTLFDENTSQYYKKINQGDVCDVF